MIILFHWIKCNFASTFQDLENPALRLKDSVIQQQQKPEKDGTQEEEAVKSSQLSWQYFDEQAYIELTKVLPGQDAYAKNKFNQASSDRLKSNRDVPDTRHPR